MSARTRITREKNGGKLSRDYIDATRAFWQPYAPRELSREDARQMAHNLVGFFNVLRDWKIAERAAGDAQTAAPTATPESPCAPATPTREVSA